MKIRKIGNLGSAATRLRRPPRLGGELERVDEDAALALEPRRLARREDDLSAAGAVLLLLVVVVLGQI
jgi:hypothetical protein